jgi:hypothetical protein
VAEDEGFSVLALTVTSQLAKMLSQRGVSRAAVVSQVADFAVLEVEVRSLAMQVLLPSLRICDSILNGS